MIDIGAQFDKILLHYEKKEYAVADKLLDDLLTSNPNFHRGLFMKGIILEETGKSKKAKDFLDKAGNVFTLTFRLALQLQESDPERAMIYFDRVSEMDPKNNMIWFSKGQLLEKLGRPAEAKECYRRLEPLREFLSRILIPAGFMIFLISGAVMMIKKGENALAIVVVASAIFCMFWLKRDGGKALEMVRKKRQASK